MSSTSPNLGPQGSYVDPSGDRNRQATEETRHMASAQYHHPQPREIGYMEPQQSSSLFIGRRAPLPPGPVSALDISPSHAQARAEILHRTLRTSPRATNLELKSPSTTSNPAEYGLGQSSRRDRLSHESRSQNRRPPAILRSSGDSISGPVHGSPQSLSVFNAPTATFMWPDFQSSSQMGTVPKIYVEYKSDRPREAPSHALHRSSSGYAVSESSEEASPTLSHKRKPSTDLPRPEKKPSLNNILEPFKSLDSSAPRRRILMNSTRRKIQITHQRTNSPEPQAGQSSRAFHPTQPIHQPNYQPLFAPHHDRSPRPEDLPLESPEESRAMGTPSGHSESLSTIMTSSFKNEEEWETSAQPFKAPDGSAKWQCLWKTYDNGKECLCMYTAKKQLVKRHVETTHLKYRPFVCSICEKKFPQKTSLDTHMHGHTGATPHDCRFEGCGLSFKDPARRHRHMVEEHNYKPKPSQRRQKSGQGLGDSVQFESMTSWAGDD